MVLTIMLIAIVITGSLWLSKKIGNPFHFITDVKPAGRYDVTRASKNLPVLREPKDTLTLDQVAEMRQYFENQDFEALNLILEDFQNDLEIDTGAEFKVHDAFSIFETTLPHYAKLFEAWLDYSPERYAPYLARAHYYYAKGWQSRGHRIAKDTSAEQMSGMRFYFQKSAADAEAALDINPRLLKAYAVQLCIANITGDNGGEVAAIGKALDLYPDSFLIRSTYMWANEPRWGGSYAEMEAIAKEAEAYAQDNPALTSLYGFIYCDQGRRMMRRKKYRQAMAHFNRAISYGDHWSFYKERARCYHYYLKDPGLALEDIEQSIFIRPTRQESYRLRSKIHYKNKDMENALEDLLAAELFKPGDSKTQAWRQWAGKNLMHQGNKVFEADFNQAVEKYNLSISFNPDSAEVYYWRGAAYYRLEQFEPALADIETSIDIDARHFDSYLMMDYILLQTKEWDKIIGYWDRYIELGPDHDRAYLERAGTYYHQKKYAKSLKDLKSACDLGNAEGCKRYAKYNLNFARKSAL